LVEGSPVRVDRTATEQLVGRIAVAVTYQH
jgi:hypothetical protein